MRDLALNASFLLLAQAGPEAGGDSFFDIVFSGGPVGVLIMCSLIGLSVIALALVVEHLLTIRRGVLMPPELIEQVTAHLNQGKLAPAIQSCAAHPSSLGHILRESMAEAEGGWTAVEKALEDATAEQAARLFRKIEYLSVIGNIGPMLGLLGTVVGMILAFREVANTQGAANAAQLASGIYSALVTTVAGLLIAIPALGAFAMFRNRVDELVAEMAYTAQHILLPVKRALTGRRQTAATPSAPPGGGG